ncbi:MAG: hypothetical protein ACYDA5_04250 [Vulcanimicrobiaceae bacterium]
MHFDIVEAIRQKQRKHARSVSIDNGDMVDISIDDGKVVVRPGVRPQEEIEPTEILPQGD